jgi:hypothetical protein
MTLSGHPDSSISGREIKSLKRVFGAKLQKRGDKRAGLYRLYWLALRSPILAMKAELKYNPKETRLSKTSRLWTDR